MVDAVYVHVEHFLVTSWPINVERAVILRGTMRTNNRMLICSTDFHSIDLNN